MPAFRPASLSVLGLLTLGLPAPAPAQVAEPPGASHPMAQVMIDLETVRLEIAAIEFPSRFCLPPIPPSKAHAEQELAMYELSLRNLRRRFRQIHQTYQRVAGSRLGGSYVAGFPMIDGLRVDHPRYWARGDGQISAVERLLRDKRSKMPREEDCSRRLPPPTEQPPPPPPPPPPGEPIEKPDRPVRRDVQFPMPPPYFCSDFERRQWLIDHFNPYYLAAGENAAEASAYRAEMDRRLNQAIDAKRGAATLEWLKQEADWAEKHSAHQQAVLRETERHRAFILSVPVVDCNELKQRTSRVPSPTGRWTLTVTGELALPIGSASGTAVATPPGRPFTTALGPPSQHVSSWAFGAGADLLNGVLTAEGRPERVAPFDFSSPQDTLRYLRKFGGGFRIDRPLTSGSRLFLEGRVRVSGSAPLGPARQLAEATADSLSGALRSLLRQTDNVSVTSTVTERRSGNREVWLAGGVLYSRHLFDLPNMTLALGVAGGVMVPSGQGPAISLVTDYRFERFGTPFRETDALEIARVDRWSVGVQGEIGLHRDVTDRLGFSVSGLLLALRNRQQTRITATPTSASGTPAGAVAFTSTPSIQFSNTTQFPSSLSDALRAFPVVHGTGLRFEPQFTAGLTIKF